MRFVALTGVAAVALALAAAAPAARSKQPYPVLLERGNVRVYARAAGQPWGRCPRAPLKVRATDLRGASGAVLLAVPRFYANETNIDVRGATARAARLGAAEWRLARISCGSRIAQRTIAVGVGFPRVNWSASLSSAVFFVSRVADGWIIWHQAH